VLGSRGSVVPIFKQQILIGGPITVTHKDVERFFMTIPEAVHLVLQAFAMGKGEDVFLLEMGEPVKIYDLARDMIKLSGLELGLDIEIEFTGLSHGEKMSEELWYENTEKQPTEHPEISSLKTDNQIFGKELESLIKKLHKFAEKGDEEQAVILLEEAIPGANISTNLPPDFTAV
jgi:FlaA1/EpsC-like NDP-sugar epimerase